MTAALFTACEKLAGATANGVYQGVLVTVLAGMMLRWCGRTNAATRHAVWFGVLLLVTALIPAQLFLSCLPRPEIPAASGQTAGTAPALALPSFSPEDATGSSLAGLASNDSLPHDPDADGLRGEPVHSEIGSAGQPDAVTSERPWWSFVPAIPRLPSWNLVKAIRLPHWFCAWVISVWALLASIRGGLIAARIREVRRVKTTSTAASEDLQARFNRLCNSRPAKRKVQLRLSSTHSAAVVLGFAHPVVLLPTEMENDANGGEVEHVLRHELAHVDRWDDWANLAQQLVQAGLFFHPAVWWISARLSLEREIACDDHVLATGRARDYALTLANVAGRMSPCRHLLAPGVSTNRSQLKQRISMILNTHRDRSPRLARSRLGFITTATVIVAALAITAGPRLVVAQSIVSDAVPPTPGAPVGVTAPATLPPDAVIEAGPRLKADRAGYNYAPRIAVVADVPEVPAVPPVPAVAPVGAAPAMPATPPPARIRKRNLSVEERLDRIERALEDLGSHEGMKIRFDADAISADINAKMAAKRAGDEAKRAAEMAQHAVQAGQLAAMAGQRAAEAGQRNAERAMRDAERMKDKDFERLQESLSELQAEAPLKALQALRSAHDSLGRQMQALERQIQRLEDDQNRPKKPAKVKSDSSDEAPKARIKSDSSDETPKARKPDQSN